MPTLGHMMQAAGYYTSYKGKLHLSRINYERNWTRIPGGISPTTENAMEKFGFDDYGFDGAAVGLRWDGYKSDIDAAGDAARAVFDSARSDKAGQDTTASCVGKAGERKY